MPGGAADVLEVVVLAACPTHFWTTRPAVVTGLPPEEDVLNCSSRRWRRAAWVVGRTSESSHHAVASLLEVPEKTRCEPRPPSCFKKPHPPRRSSSWPLVDAAALRGGIAAPTRQAYRAGRYQHGEALAHESRSEAATQQRGHARAAASRRQAPALLPQPPQHPVEALSLRVVGERLAQAPLELLPPHAATSQLGPDPARPQTPAREAVRE